MTDHSVTHATFTLERTYAVSPDRVFAAWADPTAKANWFSGPDGEHELDFRVGGREINRAKHSDGESLTFESVYHDIVPNERVVYTSTLHGGATLATVSLTTVQFTSDGDGTRLLLTEQGTFLDGHEELAWRERGTGDWLAALGQYLLRNGQ
ncbi:SRPBCC family protein [Streptomyces acidicola]|uniref:SRPBCC family protein n=1 Tax=Streptomyces acidicola TaxID=2596892 RepID=UPI0038194CB9